MLDSLFQKYDCDKSSKGHHYYLEYEKHLEPMREEKINILEIGIFKGTSMSAFHDYLPNAEIYGIDVFTRVPPEKINVLERDRIHWLKADSTSFSFTHKVTEKWPDVKFDVIIDDGLHFPEANQKTFDSLISLLKDNGVFYVEDAWPLDIMTMSELKHPWVLKHQDEYNIFKMTNFLTSVEKYNVERIDLRKKSKKPDSYIFKVTK